MSDKSCGRTTGHGERCVAGYLCGPCETAAKQGAASAADKARIAALEQQCDETKALLDEALMAVKLLCPGCKSKWVYRHCGGAPASRQERASE